MIQRMLFEDRKQYERELMLTGRRLQSIGRLMEEDPQHLVGEGFDFDPAVTGPRPVKVDMDKVRAMFDPAEPQNVGRLLAEYQQLLANDK